MGIQLELGPGTAGHPRSTWALDLHHVCKTEKYEGTWDITNGEWPVRDESVDHVYCSHLFEHIAKGDDTITVMNEAWRVLKPGGIFTIICPVIGVTNLESKESAAVGSWQPYADPTHVQFVWLPQTFQYFTGEVGASADYGLKEWKPLGPLTPPEEITMELRREGEGQSVSLKSFWTLRDGWEGVVRLTK